MNDNEILIIDDSGAERLCDIFFTHDIDDKSYVVFQFKDTLEVSAAEFIPDPNKPEEGAFVDITDDGVWDILDEILEAYEDNLEDEDDFEDDDDDAPREA
jgi:uncharacterized protein YrzB (UPF0473 family)